MVGNQRSVPASPRRGLGPDDFSHLDFVEQVFLPAALARGYTAPGHAQLLHLLVQELMAEATVAAGAPRGGPARASDTSAPDTSVAAAAPLLPPPAPLAAETVPPLPTQRPIRKRPIVPPRGPSGLSRWWRRTREAVGSDLAVHGLAYLGVLLFFVGAFGLVAFAFGDVAPTLRPLAEAVIALAPFLAAVILQRRGAQVVGRALEVAGGLVLPIILITTFLDGVALPPDLSGPALVLGLTLAMGAVAGGYARWARLRPDSSLALLVAPVAWLGIAMATLGLGRPIPAGKAVATASAVQAGAMTAALVLSVVWARLRPRDRLSEPTLVAAVPGLAVISGLGLLSWVAEDGPAISVLATGLLGLLALELLADRLPARLVGVLQPMWWSVACLAGSSGAPEVGLEPVAVTVLATAGFVGILENAHAARRPALGIVLPAIGATLALLAVVGDARWAAVAFAGASVWAAVRRRAPFGLERAPMLLDLAAAVLPMAALGSFAVASSAPDAVLAAGIMSALATVPAHGRFLARGGRDRYWLGWWSGACSLTVGGVILAWAATTTSDTGDRWRLVATLSLVAGAVAVGPVPRRWRVPSVAGLGGTTWVAAASVLGISTEAVVVILGLAGVALIAVAHSTRPPTLALDRVSVGLSGHALGMAAALLALPGPARWLGLTDLFPKPAAMTETTVGWPVTIAVGVAAAGWAITGWLDAKGRSPVGAGLGRVHPALRWVPLSLAMAGLPLTVALALDRTDVLTLRDRWVIVVPATAALACAALGRVAPRVPGNVLDVAAWAGYVLSLAAVVVSTDSLPCAVSLAVLTLTSGLTPAARRAALMTWSAWLAIVPAASLLVAEYSTWFSSLATEAAVALALVAGGSVLLIGGAVADLRGRSWAPRSRPQHAWALPPVLLGALEVGAGVATAVLAGQPSAFSALLAWVTIGAAAAILATAALARAGSLAAVAVILAWSGTVRLAEPEIAARPWIAVVVAAALLVAAQALSSATAQDPAWARWDVWLLLAAVPVAATGLVLAAAGAVPTTYTAVGALCLAVAIRVRGAGAVAIPVGGVGTVLVLIGAERAGTGWLALALVGLAAGLTALAVQLDGSTRTAAQIGGALAAFASWRVASDWLGLGDQQAIDLVAVASGVLAVVAVWAALRSPIDQSWVRVWGGSASAVAGIATWDAATPLEVARGEVQPSWLLTAGLLLVGSSLAMAARPLALGWLRDLGLGYAFASLLVALFTLPVDRSGQVVLLSATTTLIAAVTLALRPTRLAAAWQRPLVGVGTASAVLSLGAALAGAPPMARVPALSAAAVQAAAAGVALRRLQLQLASPVLAALAWVAFAAEALDGNPQWVTLPLGLATLVVVGLWRQDRLGRGERVATAEIIALERLGVILLVGSSFVQAVTQTLAYTLAAMAIGLGVVAWGVVTQVRRRVAAGALVVLAALLLLVGVPLVNLLPRWEGAGLWVLIAALGLGAVLVASMIEQGKAAVRKGLARVADITAGWE